MSILVQDVFAGLISTAMVQQVEDIQAKKPLQSTKPRREGSPGGWGTLMRRRLTYFLFASDFALRDGSTEEPNEHDLRGVT